ncbi:hypothetical protein BDV18DRAFT_158296 [Aspergillus unguis]
MVLRRRVVTGWVVHQPIIITLCVVAVAVSEDGFKPADSEPKMELSSGKSPLSSNSPVTPSFSRRSSISHSLDTSLKRKRTSHEYVLPISITCYPKTMLPVHNHDLLRKYYEKAFDSLQQTNCRILAKAYIKLVEPRKQVNYPYNGHKTIAGVPQQFDPEETRPLWWPSGVTHREPDHLRKPERIRLLVYILCDLRESHSVTVDKLKEADQSIRRQISPVERLQVLDEIYRVRGEEERYLDGRSDGQTPIYVSRVNLPDMADCQSSVYSPAGSALGSDSAYREDIPDLESHTSVFSSGISAHSHARRPRAYGEAPVSIPPTIPAVPTTWDASHSSAPVPVSLPSLHSSIRHFGQEPTAASYAFNFPTSTFAQYEPTPALAMQQYPVSSYSTLPPQQTGEGGHAQQGHAQSHTSMPVRLSSDNGMSSSPHPYYFGYN